MEINTVAVLGGSGFVGKNICEALAAEGYRVRVATRDRERAKRQLILLPTAEVERIDVHDPRALARFVRGAEAVVNLVGVLHDGRGPASFREAHIELSRKVVAACREAGARRLLHMSALAAGRDGPSAYLRSKGEAEALVRESGLAWTIFRPSVIFGPGDGFINLFARALRMFPVMPLPCPEARFQPVYVEDVAAAFVRSLPRLESAGRAYDLCGPRVYTHRELVGYVAGLTGHRRPVIALNDAASYAQACSMELPPFRQILGAMGMLMTRDNYYSMKVPSVCGAAFPFGISPTPLEAVAPTWLTQRNPRARYSRFRELARRNDSVTGDR
jgi:NADH dehydrogenase